MTDGIYFYTKVVRGVFGPPERRWRKLISSRNIWAMHLEDLCAWIGPSDSKTCFLTKTTVRITCSELSGKQIFLDENLNQRCKQSHCSGRTVIHLIALTKISWRKRKLYCPFYRTVLAGHPDAELAGELSYRKNAVWWRSALIRAFAESTLPQRTKGFLYENGFKQACHLKKRYLSWHCYFLLVTKVEWIK